MEPMDTNQLLKDDAPAGFGSATENLVLRGRIRDEIARDGPMTFRRFMELALYDPDEGYYVTREAVGTRGDYLTSPELHPLFGALVARQLAEMWELLGQPAAFRLVEAGAGSGALARAILSNTPDGLQQALRYVIVERSSARVAQQRHTLGALAAGCAWSEALGAGEARAAACVLSNELVDSFPVHRVVVLNGCLQELFVDLDADGERSGFVERPGPLSTPELERYFERLGLLPGEGCEAEVNLDALRWIAECADAVQRGFVLTIDYGYPAPVLYASWRRQGTLLSFHQHTVGTDPYRYIGRQDITAHVDFTSLAAEGRRHGLLPIGFTTQQRFLSNLGIGDALAGGPAAAPRLEEYLARRRAVEALLDAQGLGRIRVLAQAKGVEAVALRGFAGSEAEVPL